VLLAGGHESDGDSEQFEFASAERCRPVLNSETIGRVNDARSQPYSNPLEQHPIVRGVVDYVEEHYTSSISLRDVAHALGYSPAHLTHKFSSLTGTPVTAWIIKRRLYAAQALLVETRQNVVTVCEAVGFGDLCYFTRQFVRHVGVTPAKFRSANKNTVGIKLGRFSLSQASGAETWSLIGAGPPRRTMRATPWTATTAPAAINIADVPAAISGPMAKPSRTPSIP
jgi:AraC-like DNA-binding protein